MSGHELPAEDEMPMTPEQVTWVRAQRGPFRPRTCDDCGESVHPNDRRVRCHNCDLLVCRECRDQIHGMGAP